MIANAVARTAIQTLVAAKAPVTTFGFSARANWRPGRLEQSLGLHQLSIFDVTTARSVGQVSLRVAGRHQVANAAAATRLPCCRSQARRQHITRGLSRFTGLRRRLEHVAHVGEIDVLDDYAHHPTEVRAALAAVRLMYPGRRVWCVFQPHQVSHYHCA